MRFKVHPLFIIFSLVAIFFGYGVMLLNYMLVVVLHELSHSFVAYKLGYSLNNFVLLPQGAQVSGMQSFNKTSDEIKIAIAGPLTNIILALLCVAVWWIWPESYAITYSFAICNFVTAVFNILPILPLDGGRIVVALFAFNKKRKVGVRITNIFAIAFSTICFVIFVYSLFVVPNLNYLIMSIFLILPVFDNGKNNVYVSTEQIFFKVTNKTKHQKANIFVVSRGEKLASIVHLLNRHRYNIAYVVDEKTGDVVANLFEREIYELLEKNGLNKSLSDVI